MYTSFEKYNEKINVFLDTNKKHTVRVKNLSFIQTSALQRYCLEERISFIDFIAWVEGFCPFPLKKDNLSEEEFILPDFMKTIDQILSIETMSKRELCRRLDFDRANFYKLYHKGKSINLEKLLRIIDALEVSLLFFIWICYILKYYQH